MKIKLAVLTLFTMLVTGFPALAANDPTRLLLLQTPVTVNGVEIPKGVYEFAVDSEKSNATITVKKQGRIVATAPATLVKSGVTYKKNVVMLSVNSDGSRALYEIRLAGSSQAIMLEDSATVAQLNAK